MTVLLCKLALAPAFVVLVSIAVRRLGPRIGGIFGGLPVVAGPILFVYALDHGTAFAADAAANSLKALIALSGFVLAAAFVSGRVGDGSRLDGSLKARSAARVAWHSVVFGWLVFSALAALVALVELPPIVSLAACAVAFVVALRLLPQPDPAAPVEAPGRPPHDLLLRGSAAAAMVLVLTSLAGTLGPTASGVLAPFPIITSVLAGFAIAHEPRATTLRLMRGMLRGFFSFATFLFVVTIAVEPLGTAAAFLSGIAATAVIQIGLVSWAARAARPATSPMPLPAVAVDRSTG
ncbi:MAG: hypothetical protein Q7T55_09440 [Solirubrobacteraceae bacterium]|nr:hypothetical protein [Solirubrobacteraceae bacterium]